MFKEEITMNKKLVPEETTHTPTQVNLGGPKGLNGVTGSYKTGSSSSSGTCLY